LKFLAIKQRGEVNKSAAIATVGLVDINSIAGYLNTEE